MMQIRLLPRTTLQVLARPAAPHGLDGWTPVFAMAQDGDRRVQQVVNWTGGQGDKPATGWYIGSSGFVETIAEATDIRGITGTRGWSPVFSIVSDALRRIQMLSDWTGGTGTKPAIIDNGNALYVGASGFTTVLADAVDVRGLQGTPGWSPVLATVTDGERRVQQVFDWTGGEGGKPVTGQYVSSGGLTSDIAEATDIRGARGATGPEWTPTNNSITNEFLVDMPANTLKGRTGTAGDPQDLSAAQAWEVVGQAGKASSSQVAAGTDDSHFVTPATLRESVGWRILQNIKLMSPVSVIYQSIPSDVSQLRFFGAPSMVDANLFMRVSYDGGATFHAEYVEAWVGHSASTPVSASSAHASAMNLSGISASVFLDPSFSAHLHVANAKAASLQTRELHYSDTVGLMNFIRCVYATQIGRPTNLMIFPSVGLIEADTVITIEGC